MKNLFFISLACVSYCMPVCAQTDDVEDSQEDSLEEVLLDCEIDYKDETSHSPHRTHPRVPTVYFNRSANKLLFAEPSSGFLIELIDVETEEVVFTLPVMYGVTQVQLPQLNSGQYKLKIIRGNYCFTGEIEI